MARLSQAGLIELRGVALAPIATSLLEAVADRSNSLAGMARLVLALAAVIVAKAGQLLPQPSEVESVAEELDAGQQRDLLLLRLLEGQLYRRLSSWFADRMALAATCVARQAGPNETEATLGPRSILSGATLTQLVGARDEVAARLRSATNLRAVSVVHLHSERHSLTATLQRIARYLAEMDRAGCSQLVRDETDRDEIVAVFLALLELHRQGLVDLQQSDPSEPAQAIWMGGSIDSIVELAPVGR
jgi:segregation and condensation protein A